MAEQSYKIKDHVYEIERDDDEGGWYTSVWYSCGYCGETVIDMDEYDYEFVKRCPHCKKLIDWDGWDRW